MLIVFCSFLLTGCEGQIITEMQEQKNNSEEVIEAAGDEASETVIPADIPYEYSEKVRKEAIRAYRAIGARGLSRADFFITKDGLVLVNELNTLPGFTSISMYPKLWMHEGISYPELLTRLINLAYEV